MFKQTKLKNSLELITVPMTGTQTATVLVLVGTGSKYEAKRQGGISHFLEHLFFKGTKKRPNTLAISSALDGIGAEFNAYTGKEYTGYYVKANAQKIEVALDVMSDMLRNSKFDPKEIEREKGVINEEINMKLDDPMSYTEDLFEQLLYGDTPAGRDIIGTRKTVNSFTRQDFLEYVSSQYAAKNKIICVAGNIGSQAKAQSLVEKYFLSGRTLGPGQKFQEKKKVVEQQQSPNSLFHYKKTDQAHLALGVRTYGYGHHYRAILKIVALLLGGSMSSRMFINLREKRGLAYYVRTQAEHYTDSGYLVTRAGVPVDKVDTAVKIIIQEYKKIKSSLVNAVELKRNKDLVSGRAAIQLEASDNQADWYAGQAVMYNAINRLDPKAKTAIRTPREYLRLVNRITPAQIKQVAGEIFVNRGLNLALIGPFKDKKRFVKILKI